MRYRSDLSRRRRRERVSESRAPAGPGAVQGERPVPETRPDARQQALVPLGAETHGGEDVALFGTGPGAQRVRGVIEQNRVYDIMRAAFGWDE